MTRILGIDPGYERLGVAVLAPVKNLGISKKTNNSKEEIIFSECFKTSAKLAFEERLLALGDEVRRIIKKYKPEVLAIETLFLTTNQKTVMRVAEARGVVIYEAKRAGLRVFEASPLQIKVATTGYGKASKEQMMKMVRMLIDISKAKRSDDELDAVAVALTAVAHLKL